MNAAKTAAKTKTPKRAPAVKNFTAEAEKLIAALNVSLGKTNERMKTLDAELAELKRQGLIYATEYWRPRKAKDPVLYLHYPQDLSKGQERDRVYIGDDPKKVAEALAGVQRAKTYDEKAGELQQLTRQLNGATVTLSEAHAALEGRSWRGW